MKSNSKVLISSKKCSDKPLSNLTELFYYGDIMAKPRMVRSDRWAKRPCVLRYWEFSDRLINQAREFVLGNSFDVVFYIAMSKSWSKKKKKEKLYTVHDQKPDTSNMLKSIEDILMKDDSCIWHPSPYKFWAEESSIYIRNHTLEEQEIAMKYSKGVPK